MIAYRHVVLDTSAYSNFRNGHSRAAALVAAAEVITLPAIVVGELEAGFALGRRTAENQLALTEFRAEPAAQVLDVTVTTARLYARIFARLRIAGTPVPFNDMWIAAAAMECGGAAPDLRPEFPANRRIGTHPARGVTARARRASD